MPMGIDNDYDGVGNEADDTPNGDPAAMKVKQLLEALANLLGGNEPAAPPMPAVGGMPGAELGESAPPTGGDPVMGLMDKLKGAPPGGSPPAPPELAAGPPPGEDEGDELPGDKAKGAMGKLAKLRGGK